MNYVRFAGHSGNRPRGRPKVRQSARSVSVPGLRASFLLAIILDLAGCRVRRAWLIPMSELESVARVGSKKLSITPSAKESSKDRYAPYRCSDMAQVAQRLTEFMDRRD